jgi:trans-aconitate 2-methyltransferase
LAVSGDERARYTFGDSATASERLARVARVFAPSTEALLARLTDRAPARVLDLGCGPGHTTRLLAQSFAGAAVCGLEQSDAFLAEARRTAAPGTSFEHADVTAMPLPGTPAELVYARFVLSHLREREPVLRGWFDALAARGVLVVEEVDRIETIDATFRDYLAITSGLMADRGGELYVGPELSKVAHRLGGSVLVDTAVSVTPATTDVATMFALNLQSWRDDPWVATHHAPRTLDDLADALHAHRSTAGSGLIRWSLRQVVVAREP